MNCRIDRPTENPERLPEKGSRRREEADAWMVAGSNVRLVTSSATSSQSVQLVRRVRVETATISNQ